MPTRVPASVQLLFMQQAIKGSVEEFRPPADGAVTAGKRCCCPAKAPAAAHQSLSALGNAAGGALSAARSMHEPLELPFCTMLRPGAAWPSSPCPLPAPACPAEDPSATLSNGLWSLLLAFGVLLCSLLCRQARSWRFLNSPMRWVPAVSVALHACWLATPRPTGN